MIILLVAAVAGQARELPLDLIQLPPGFRITLFADDVPNARAMALGARGTLFVGSRAAGKVYALVDEDGDQRADRRHVIASGLEVPVGVAFHDGDLYVSALDRIVRLRDIESRLTDPPLPETVSAAFPAEAHHGWKFIAFGPDGRLYVPVGAPCNICDSGLPYAAIHRMHPDGSGLEPVAEGVRNTVGFDWHPQTGELWFTDNGRDWLGDDQPPDELNRLTETGQHFGYPYCHGGDIADPDFGHEFDCTDFVAPVQRLGPHVAALGMRFYRGTMFPPDYRGDVLIAEHGSWNRTEPIGYRVTRVRLDTNGRSLGYEVFASGWLHDGNAWGRPVDVLEMPDGALLVSDDFAGAIYRISYRQSD